ncbi:MAG: DUF4430 domain-containing protein [bacterium]
MGKIVRIIAVAVFCVVMSEVRAENQNAHVKENNNKIIVEIDYGNIRLPRTAEVSSTEGKTVLEVLQTVATVETHPVDQYVFVTSIDGVSGKRGETAWYYKVDDKLADELAYSKILSGTERVKWIYKKDECSWKVDGKFNK